MREKSALKGSEKQGENADGGMQDADRQANRCRMKTDKWIEREDADRLEGRQATPVTCKGE